MKYKIEITEKEKHTSFNSVLATIAHSGSGDKTLNPLCSITLPTRKPLYLLQAQ